MIYVLRDGQLVEKAHLEAKTFRPVLPNPHVSRFEPMESPVTGQSISSWRQRDRDMQAVDAVDRRDIPNAAFEKRRKVVERNARADKP
jgi:hypothetical protein